MFKIGDIVEITEESDAMGMLDFKYGKGYKVLVSGILDVVSGNPMIFIEDESGNSMWYAASHFKLKGTTVEKKECLFKEGQVVWDVVYGKGVVVEIADYSSYPVIANFSDETMAYTEDGRTYESHGRTLFFSEPKIEAATEPLFEPTLKKGDVVVLSDRDADHIANVVAEDADNIYYDTADGVVAHVEKNSVHVFRLGEKINFK